MAIWEVRDCFDVWGNKKDGYEINDSANMGRYEISDNIIDDDKKLLEFMVSHNWLTTSDRRKLTVNGECGIIEIMERKTERPLYLLVMMEYVPSKGRKVR